MSWKSCMSSKSRQVVLQCVWTLARCCKCRSSDALRLRLMRLGPLEYVGWTLRRRIHGFLRAPDCRVARLDRPDTTDLR